MPAIDPNTLPKDVESLRKIVVDLCEQLRHESSEKDKFRSLLRELLEAQRTRKSEQLSKEQLALFESLWKVSDPEDEESEPAVEEQQDKPDQEQTNKRSGRQPLAKNVVRERIVHDLAEVFVQYVRRRVDKTLGCAVVRQWIESEDRLHD